MVSFLPGCGTTGTLEITSPREGATITGELELHMEVNDVEYALQIVYFDGVSIDDFSSDWKNPCADCVFMTQIPALGVADGDHEIRVELEFDETTLAADEVNVTFDRL